MTPDERIAELEAENAALRAEVSALLTAVREAAIRAYAPVAWALRGLRMRTHGAESGYSGVALFMQEGG